MRTRRLSVLIVDDYPDAADSLAELIRLYGHRATVARTSTEALSVADRELPDVVLLELRLRGMDGWQVAHWLREQVRVRVLAPMLLVAVTTCGHEADYRRSVAAGIDLHLLKPTRTCWSECWSGSPDGSPPRPRLSFPPGERITLSPAGAAGAPPENGGAG